MASADAIAAGSAKFPKPADRDFQYGTAGVSRSLDITKIPGLSPLSLVSYESVSVFLPDFASLKLAFQARADVNYYIGDLERFLTRSFIA